MEDRGGGDGGEEEKKKERSEGKERRESRKMIDAFPDILYMHACTSMYTHTQQTTEFTYLVVLDTVKGLKLPVVISKAPKNVYAV